MRAWTNAFDMYGELIFDVAQTHRHDTAGRICTVRMDDGTERRFVGYPIRNETEGAAARRAAYEALAREDFK